MDNPNFFQFTYSANGKLPDQVTPSSRTETGKSASVHRATVLSIIIGTVFLLIFGSGMSLTLSLDAFVSGILIGIVGIIGMALTPKLWLYLYKKKTSTAASDSEKAG